VLDAFHLVVVRTTAPVAVDGVAVDFIETNGSGRVGKHDNVALFCKEGGVPACAPS